VLVFIGLLGLLPIVYLHYLIFYFPTSPTFSLTNLEGEEAFVINKINPGTSQERLD